MSLDDTDFELKKRNYNYKISAYIETILRIFPKVWNQEQNVVFKSRNMLIYI